MNECTRHWDYKVLMKIAIIIVFNLFGMRPSLTSVLYVNYFLYDEESRPSEFLSTSSTQSLDLSGSLYYYCQFLPSWKLYIQKH